MDDSPDAIVNDGDDADPGHVVSGSASSGELEVSTSTTLVEAVPGIAVVFGEVPEGLELIDLTMIPMFDRAQLSTAFGSIGNAGTVLGNLAKAASSARGLYRLDDATLSLLKAGGELATKDGAKLGAIFQNGKLVAQARFIPAAMTAGAAIAAIGPAVAMIALQMQLGEISALVRTNIAIATQTLKTIRHEQWSELEGIAESVDVALEEAREIDSISGSVWEPIAPSGPMIRKQMKMYRKNVAGHVQELGRLAGRDRRNYLESNAEAIIFDTYALLTSLKTHAGYQAIRGSLARIRGANEESEAKLFDRITRSVPPEIEDSLSEIRQLVESLVRELRIIAELPGRATLPLTKKRQASKVSKLTCAQLLQAIEPLANSLQPAVEMPLAPDIVCAPEELDLDPYLHILRWFLRDGEQLRGVAFLYQVGPHNLAGAFPAILANRVDAAWDSLAPEEIGRTGEILASSTFVAVTDRRIITATPKSLLTRGELGATYPLDTVRYVRPRTKNSNLVRPTIGITTEERDVQWMFPTDAGEERIDELAALISEGAAEGTAAQIPATRVAAETP